MNLQDEAKNFLLRFLTGYEDENVFKRFRIGYTADTGLFSHYDLVFVPSGFFESENYGKESSLPRGPLPQINGVPFFYGESRIERAGSTVVVYADLPATAFFLLSRYEEICLRHVRDTHGRFPGKASLLYRNNLIFRPILDEYTVLVRNWLREAGVFLPPQAQKIGKVWLTHDIDAPFYCKSVRSFFREAFGGRGVANAFRLFTQKREADPYYSFPWMMEQDMACKQVTDFPVQIVYFLKAGGGTVHDRPVYRLRSRRIRHLIAYLQAQKVSFGLHGSYFSGGMKADPKEKHRLESAIDKKIFFFRNHFLRSCEPEHFLSLEAMGITDDFTMGYADVAGFRLGTSRPCIWIDPNTGRLTRLVLHPLTVMDSSLSDLQYMGLDEETARKYCTLLFHPIRQYGGEVCLLWHNTTVSDAEYPASAVRWQRRFYAYLLDYLAKM